MSFEDSASGGERRSWRPEADILTFPAQHIFREQPGHRGDQVAVTHMGQTLIFGSPQAMYASLREADPILQQRLEELGAGLRTLEEIKAEVEHDRGMARRAREAAERRLQLVGRGVFLALLLMVAAILGGFL